MGVVWKAVNIPHGSRDGDIFHLKTSWLSFGELNFISLLLVVQMLISCLYESEWKLLLCCVDSKGVLATSGCLGRQPSHLVYLVPSEPN